MKINIVYRMVRLPNLINKTLFRSNRMSTEKKTSNNSINEDFSCTKEIDELNIDDGESPSNRSCTNNQQTQSIIEETFTTKTVDMDVVKKTYIDRDHDNPTMDVLLVKDNVVLDTNQDLEGESIMNLKQQIQGMKRSFLFEKNQLVEKFEQENFVFSFNFFQKFGFFMFKCFFQSRFFFFIIFSQSKFYLLPRLLLD